MASKTIQHIYAAIAENPSCGSTNYTCGVGGNADTTLSGVGVSFQQQQTKTNDDNNVEVGMRTDREVFSSELPSSPQKENCNMGTKKYSKESLKLTPDTSPESSLEYAISSIDGSNGGNTDEYGSGPQLPSLNEQDVSFTNIGATTGLAMKKSSIYTTDAGGTFTQPNVITLEGQLGINNEGREQGVEQGVVATKDSLSLGSSLNNSSMPDSIELSREEDDDDVQHNSSNENGGRQQQTVSEFMKTTATPFDELSQDSISKGSSSNGSDKENVNKTFQRYPSDEALNNSKLSTTTASATVATNTDRNASPIATTQMFTTQELSSITALQMSTYLTINERQTISMQVLNSNLKKYTVSSDKVCKECNMPLLIPKQKEECKRECLGKEECLVCPELKKFVLQKILDGAASTSGSGSILSPYEYERGKKEKLDTNESSKKEDNEGKDHSQCKFLPTLPTTDNLGILQELQASLLNVYNQSIQCQADTTEYISSTTNKVYNQSIKCHNDTTEYVATTTTDAIEETRQMLVNSKLECHEADFVTSTVDKGSEIMLGKLNRSSEASSKSKEDTSANSGKKRREDMSLASCNGLDFNEVKQCTIHAMELFTSSVTRQVQCKPSSSEVTKECVAVDSVIEAREHKEGKKKKSGSVSLLDQDDDEEQEDILVDNKVIVEDASEGDVEENGSSLLLGEGIDDEEEEYDIGEAEMQPEDEQKVKKTEDTNPPTIKDNKQISLMKTSLNIVRGIGSNISTKSLTPNSSKAFVTLVTQIEEVEEKMMKTKCMKEKRRCAELLEKLDDAAGVLKEVEENKV